MQTNTRRVETQQQFVSPESVLQGLLSSADRPCNCGVAEDHCEYDEEQLNEEIKGLQAESGNIRSQVLEVERLLQVRDQLYSELDMLRQERDQIENEMECQVTYEQTQTVKCSGYKEMNERLKRRIYEVREYIQKMTFENQKIEEGVVSHQYRHQEEELLVRRREHRAHPPVYEGRRHYAANTESMIGKIQNKQEDAWRRVKRQEDDIERRNAETRMRATGGSMVYHSPKARTYYSPHREIY